MARTGTTDCSPIAVCFVTVPAFGDIRNRCCRNNHPNVPRDIWNKHTYLIVISYNSTMKKSVAVLLSFVFLFAFARLSKYEDRAFVRNLDFTVTVKVQDYVAKFCTSRCDGLFEDIGFFAAPAFSVLALLTLVAWTFYKGSHPLNGRMRSFLSAMVILVLFGVLTFIEIYGKTIVRHPAPPFFLLKNPTTIFPTYHVWQEFSYPSGHTARATFLAFLMFITIQQYNNLTMRKRLLLIGGLGIYVGLVSISRIYLGHHWLSDVVGGLLLGAGFGILAI